MTIQSPSEFINYLTYWQKAYRNTYKLINFPVTYNIYTWNFCFFLFMPYNFPFSYSFHLESYGELWKIFWIIFFLYENRDGVRWWGEVTRDSWEFFLLYIEWWMVRGMRGRFDFLFMSQHILVHIIHPKCIRTLISSFSFTSFPILCTFSSSPAQGVYM